MKALNRLFSLVLALLFCLGTLIACDSGAPGAETGTTSTPGGTEPPATRLEIDGTPISEYTLVIDTVMGWDISAIAKKFNELLEPLAGYTLPILSAASEEAQALTRKIVLTTPFSARELPFEKGEPYVGLHSGSLYFYGETQSELSTLVEGLMTSYVNKNASGDMTALIPDAFKPTYPEKLISVTAGGKDALSTALSEAASLLAEATTPEKSVHVIVELADGVYEGNNTLVYDLSGAEYGKLTIRAAEGAKPVISGLTELNASEFKQVEGTEYYAYQFEQLEDGTYPLFHDFWDEGRHIDIASGGADKTLTDFDNPGNRKDERNYKGIYVTTRSLEALGDDISFPTELTIYIEWNFVTLHVVGVDWSDTKAAGGGLRLVRLKLEETEFASFVLNSHRNLSLSGREYYFSNNISLLKPDSWVYNSTTGTLYYYPASGAPKAPAYSAEEKLVHVIGANSLTVEGITFTGSGLDNIAREGYHGAQANEEYRNGVLSTAALLLESCSNVKVENCTFTALGTNGIMSRGTLMGAEIVNNTFDDLSMSAISLGDHELYWTTSTAQYNIVIENNTIHNIGMEYPSATAIYISHADGLKIRHNDISMTSYTGISAGWGWSPTSYVYGEYINIRNADIAYNKITDYMQLLRDGAAIYVLGGNVDPTYTEYFNFMHDNYIERVKFKDDSKRGYYLDGAASNWEVWDNVCIGSRLPIFSQFHVSAQFTHNNYIHDIYTDYAIDQGNHAPDRATILGENFVVKEGKDALFAAYPKAKEIMEAAGVQK